MRDMELIDVRGMSLYEYCGFVEGRVVHLGISPMELNIQLCEKGLIDWERYERAKWELQVRLSWDMASGEIPLNGGNKK